MPLNLQLILDDAFDALIAQGQPATTPKGNCQYRVGGTDLKCALGHLIPDANYTPDMEDQGLFQVALLFETKYGQDPEVQDIKFLNDLQSAHDDAEAFNFIPDLRTHFNNIANHYNLKAPTA